MPKPKLDPGNLRLYSGSHKPPEDGAECKVCIEEAVALHANIPWTDHPERHPELRISPVIAEFLRWWNDGMDDDDRNRVLVPADDPLRYIVGQLGTDRGPAVEERRGWMCVDWSVRVSLPAWLRLAGIEAPAASLTALPEIVDRGTLDAAVPLIREAARAARAAWDAWDAWDARDARAARAAEAAGAAGAARAAEAAGDAEAAGAAGAAEAAGAARAARAARAAEAARAARAARDALRPTVVEMQASARDLLDRMIDEGREAA